MLSRIRSKIPVFAIFIPILGAMFLAAASMMLDEGRVTPGQGARRALAPRPQGNLRDRRGGFRPSRRAAKRTMAAYTSTQSGPWSNPATWGGAGPPGAGDRVVINNHAVTIGS